MVIFEGHYSIGYWLMFTLSFGIYTRITLITLIKLFNSKTLNQAFHLFEQPSIQTAIPTNYSFASRRAFVWHLPPKLALQNAGWINWQWVPLGLAREATGKWIDTPTAVVLQLRSGFPVGPKDSRKRSGSWLQLAMGNSLSLDSLGTSII